MPRRLIIILLFILLIGVIGGAGFYAFRFLGNKSAEPEPQPTQAAQPFGSLQEAEQGSQQILDPTADDDNDGLINAVENVWGTLPNNSDTDGDGTSDADEIAAGRNPTIAGPNDKLPEGFEPGEDVQPSLPEAPAEPIAIDQFFADNLDLSGGNDNLTESYQSQFPENERTPDTLQQFANEQNIVTQLPTPAERATNLSTDTPLVTKEYLDIAGNLKIFSNRLLLAEALNDVFERNNPSTIRGMALQVRLHQERLIAQPVPPRAANLHQLLLGYTELLAATYDQIAMYNDDPVKAVVGMRQLEGIDKQYFPLIKQEVTRLSGT